MKNKGLVATIIIMAGVIVMLLVTLFLAKLPFLDFGIFEKAKEITENLETFRKEETKSTKEPETEPVETVTTIMQHYNGYNGSVDIEYPELKGMKDLDLQAKLNYKIKTNALSIVGLYPVSTALQRLDVYCDVKYLDDDYITILYTGRLVGNKAHEQKSQSASSDKSVSKAQIVDNDPYLNMPSGDPYLDGFVDPLLGQNIAATTNPIQGNVGLPVPVGKSNSMTGVTNYTTETTAGRANVNVNANPNQVAGSGRSASNVIGGVKAADGNTADRGPTTKEITAPTAPGSSNTKVANSAEVYGPGSTGLNNISPPSYNTGSSLPNSNIPNVENYVVGQAPVVGYASTADAGFVDQDIFYTNTISLKYCTDVYLSTYADAESIAKYARSGKVEFINVDPSITSEVKSYIKKTSLTKLIEELEEDTDFRNAHLMTWPKHFSYQDNEYTYVSFKLTSKLGNYAIIRYPNE